MSGATLPTSARRRRLALAYAVLLLGFVPTVTIALRVGSEKQRHVEVGGVYRVERDLGCLGDRVELRQSGRFVDARGAERASGELELDGRRLSGEVRCADGSVRRLQADIPVPDPPAGFTAQIGEAQATLRRTSEPVESSAACPATTLSGEAIFGRLMLAIAVVILAARLVGTLVARIGQPRVMGEVLAGILLGPTLLGTLAPGIRCYLFPNDLVPLLGGVADVGLAFYMFLVGLELDPLLLRGRVSQAALISNSSIAIPFALGATIAVLVYGYVGPSEDFLPFALFMGVSMSITAFPVLARILSERRMLRRPIGSLALASAAVDDVTAWGLLALASAVAFGGSGLSAIRVMALAVLFCLAMALLGRRVLVRVSDAYDEAGHVPAGWVTAIFVGVLVSAFASQAIGIAAIFGAFVMGLVMPRRADLTDDVTRRVEDFVTTVLLPLFFVVSGLKTNVGLLDRPELWLLTLLLLGVAIIGKWAGAMAASSYSGSDLREAAAIGALMNTRGLTELIVLNIGLELGVITPALFTMLVIMALVTTLMTGPILRLIDPRGTLSAPPEEELEAAPLQGTEPTRPQPKRSILVAALDESNLDPLIALAEPLVSSRPPRELIVASLVQPSGVATGIATDNRELARASSELSRRREALIASQVVFRTLAFTSVDPGEDLVRLSTTQQVDLILVDGRRPLLGEGVPRGTVGMVLSDAPCDVAVLVEREGRIPQLGPDQAVLVPFGGAEHDWAALELGAWLASFHGAPLRLLGAAAEQRTGGRDASRLLAEASLVVQRLVGVDVEPLLFADLEGMLQAAGAAGLLLIGLSERWRQEGLGAVRSAIAKSAPAPTVFVRRGASAGVLAPREDLTRFTWSSLGSG